MNAAITTTKRNGVSAINIVLGIWLIISPFVLGYTRYQVSEWNAIACGVAVFLLALAASTWGTLIVGIWLIISPFVLGFSAWPTMLWNNVIVGALVAIVALCSSSTPSTTVAGPPLARSINSSGLIRRKAGKKCYRE
jgi:hypothetical protein